MRSYGTYILYFLEIVVGEVNGADLLPTKKCEPAVDFTSVTNFRFLRALERLSLVKQVISSIIL